MIEVPYYDETACDRCGAPTPRLTPPVEIELCDECWAKEQERANRDAAYDRYIDSWFHEPGPT